MPKNKNRMRGPGGIQKPILGPGGVQHILGPGGIQKHILGPGGTQQNIPGHFVPFSVCPANQHVEIKCKKNLLKKNNRTGRF